MKDDWKDPHWNEEWKTERNKQIYRWTGKEPWYGWKAWLIMGLVFPNRWNVGMVLVLLALGIVVIWW